MLAKIAAVTEPSRHPRPAAEETVPGSPDAPASITDMIASSVAAALTRISPAAVFVPTLSGQTVRSITRFKLPVWIVGVSSREATCQRLLFGSGVYPQYETDPPSDWKAYVQDWLRSHEMEDNLAILTAGPSASHPEANHRMEIIRLG